jgi:hypothetical protein
MSTDQDWSKIDWTAGLSIPRESKAHELPPNWDKRYAMSIAPESLREASGQIRALEAPPPSVGVQNRT